MKRIWLTRLMAAALAAAILACGPCGGLRAEAQEPVEALGARFQSLIREGKYDDAAQVMQRIIAVAEQELGADDPSVAAALDGLGTLYTTQNRHAEAEPFFRRALAIREKTLGPDDQTVAQTLNGLATVYHHAGPYNEAEAIEKRPRMVPWPAS